MFTSKSIGQYALFFSVIIVTSYVGNYFINSLESKNDDYELIKKYLLNDSPLYGFNRPKIWIHSKYEINARKWRDFQSRNTTDLNQPYLHLTIQTIINHCGNDFNVCLIDDDSFAKLIPTWDIHLETVPEPFKSHYRNLGMLQLLYHYGGMVLPNSLVCLKNLHPFYLESLAGGKPFVCENNNHISSGNSTKKLRFVPDISIMGCKKNDATIKDMIEYVKKLNRKPHFSSDIDFRGDISKWCINAIEHGKMNIVLGEKIGVKTSKKKSIELEELMEENDLDLAHDVVAVYIPADEVLRRPKYQWFAVLPREQIIGSNLAISKCIRKSIMDSGDDFNKSTTIPSVISI
uniref:Nucleotide-diphospho-sugar transferase domain-containing protein n=1 Tax=viral metagenome TaxID=1070528 RepID=A0A6C0DRN9_9ZZZZ